MDKRKPRKKNIGKVDLQRPQVDQKSNCIVFQNDKTGGSKGKLRNKTCQGRHESKQK